MVKVIAADGFDADGSAVFSDAGGIQLDVRKGVTAEEALALIGEYDGLIVRSATKVTASLIEAGRKLKVIGRAGVGVDNVDVPAASRRGIVVMNTPEANTISTAEHTLAMLFSLARRIPEADASMKAGKWDKRNLKGVELLGKTIGVIGFGRIGRHVASVCKAMGMQVVAFLKDGAIMNAVNVPALDSEKSRLMMPFVNLGAKLGSFLAQFAKGTIRDVAIAYEGTVATMDVAPVTNAVMCGLLSHNLEGVNQVNARLLAAECGLKVTESKTASAGAYTHLIRADARLEKGDLVSVAATIFGDEMQHPRIVRVNRFHVDVVPEGFLLILPHLDAPGIIGKIGTILGNARINISRMTCDRLTAGDKNVGVFSVDQNPPDSVLETISKVDGVFDAVRVVL